MDRTVHELTEQEGQKAIIIARGVLSPEERVTLRLSPFYVCECAAFIVIQPVFLPADEHE